MAYTNSFSVSFTFSPFRGHGVQSRRVKHERLNITSIATSAAIIFVLGFPNKDNPRTNETDVRPNPAPMLSTKISGISRTTQQRGHKRRVQAAPHKRASV